MHWREREKKATVPLLTSPLVVVCQEVLLDRECRDVDDGDGPVHGAGHDEVTLDTDAPDRAAVVVEHL